MNIRETGYATSNSGAFSRKDSVPPAKDGDTGVISDIFVKSEDSDVQISMDTDMKLKAMKSDNPRSFRSRAGRALRQTVLFTTMLAGLTANVCGGMITNLRPDSPELKTELVDTSERQTNSRESADTYVITQRDFQTAVKDTTESKAEKIKAPTVAERESAVEHFITHNAMHYRKGEWMALRSGMAEDISYSLMKFDPGTLENLEEAGVKCCVIDRDNIPQEVKDMGVSEWKEGVGAYYVNRYKVVLLRQDLLENQYTIHELGHAVDDLVTPDVQATPSYTVSVFKSDNDPELQKLYDSYMERTKGMLNDEGEVAYTSKSCWSAYARTSKREYVAEGVSMYLKSNSARKTLMKKDPEMHKYIENLLKESAVNSDTLNLSRMAE